MLASHLFWTSDYLWTHQPGSHRIYPPSFCGTCMYYGCTVITYSRVIWINHVLSSVRGQLNRENELFPIAVRAWEFGLLARQVRPTTRPASACLFSTHTQAKPVNINMIPGSAYSRDSSRFPWRRPLIICTAIRYLASPEFIGSSRDCVPMTFTIAESLPAQGQ